MFLEVSEWSGGMALGTLMVPHPFLSATIPLFCSTSTKNYAALLCTHFCHAISALGSANSGLNPPQTMSKIKPCVRYLLGPAMRKLSNTVTKLFLLASRSCIGIEVTKKRAWWPPAYADCKQTRSR